MTKTKNERITILENEVAELKLIVHELRGKKSIEPSTTIVEDKPKMKRLVDGQWQATSYEEIAEMMSLTPNQQRVVIIEKAKRFIAERKVLLLFGRVDFIVNQDKRTVVALIKPLKSKRVLKKGIAKCNPNDVFNEHIGKAIALGRALGLDVSEFEQVVQPTVAVQGMAVYYKSKTNGEFIETIEKEREVKTVNTDLAQVDGHWKATIINDTNAIYGGVK